MADGIKGTWEEVIQRNEQAVRDLEQRVLQSKFQELHLWKDGQLFSIEKRKESRNKTWNIWTPKKTYFGDNIAEVPTRQPMQVILCLVGLPSSMNGDRPKERL